MAITIGGKKYDIKTQGDVKLISKFQRLPIGLYNKTMDELDAAGERIRTRMIKSMQNTSRASYFYKRPGGKKHFPSLPNKPPAIDSGELVRSLGHIIRKARGEMEVGVNTGAPYAPFLEQLDGSGEKMEERPFLIPAVKKEMPKLRNNLKEIFSRIILS